MKFVDCLKAWFGRASAPVSTPAPAPEKRGFIQDGESGLRIETDDPDVAAMIAMAFKTGKIVTGTRGEDGKMSIKTPEP